MSRLTWQNVAAPDFSAATRTQAYAAEAFDKAMGRVSDSITAFDNNRKDQADAAVLMNAMKYQNADELQAAIASGALMQGVNPDHVRAGALLTAQSQAGNLLKLGQQRQQLSADKQSFDFNAQNDPIRLQQAQHNLDKGEYDLDRVKEANTRTDAARVAGEQANQRWLGMLQSGQLDTVESQNRLFTSLNPQDLTDRALLGLLTQKRPDLATPAMLGTASSVLGGGGGIAAIGGAPSAIGGGAPAPTAPASGADAPTNSWNRLVGGGTADLSSLSIGQWEDNVAEDLIAKTKGTNIMNPDVRDEGSSASGRYQLTRRTLRSIAPTVLGEQYRDMPFTPEVQEKLGKHLYDARVNNKTNMVKEWDGLKHIAGADKEGAWDGIPWEVARNVIAQFESGDTAVLGKNPTMEDVRKYAASINLDRSTEALVADVTGSVNQWGNNLAGGPDSERFITASKSGDSPADVKLKLQQTFPDVSSTELSRAIAYTMTKAKVYAPVAAEILKGVAERKPWFDMWGAPEFDTKSLDAAIEQYQAGYGAKLKDGLLSNAATKRDTQQATEYQANVDDAKTLVDTLTKQVKEAAGLPRQKPLQRELDAAQVAYRERLLAQRTHSGAVKTNADKVITQGTTAPPAKADPAAQAQAALEKATASPSPNMAGVYSQRGAYAALNGQMPAYPAPAAPAPVKQAVAQEAPKDVPEVIKGLTPDKIKAMGREEVRALISSGKVMRALTPELQQALTLQFSLARHP